MTYEEINEEAFEFINDWGFVEYPIRMRDVCKTIGIRLKPYSELEADIRLLALSASEDAFHLVSDYLHMDGIVIAYNDEKSNYRSRFNLAHELGHIVRQHDEESPWNEKEADYFAGYFLAPVPLVIVHCPKLRIPDIVEAFNVSPDCAKVVRDHCKNRMSCGKPKKPYELRLLETCSVKGVRTSLDALEQNNRQK